MAHLAARAARDAARDVAQLLEGLLVVDEHGVDVLGEPVAHDALDEVGFLPHAAGGAQVLDVALQFVPAFEQVAHVAHERRAFGSHAGGAHDEADLVGEEQLVEDLLEAPALLGVADLAAHAARLRAGHHHEVAAGDGEVRGDAGALGGDRSLRDLHDDLRAGLELLVDLLGGEARGLAAPAALAALSALAALRVVGFAVVNLVQEGVDVGLHVPVVEEGVLLEADVDERGLQVVLQVLDAPLEDAAHQAFVLRVLDHVLLQTSVLQHRDARFELFDVHDDLAFDLVPLEPVPDRAHDCLNDRHAFSFF